MNDVREVPTEYRIQMADGSVIRTRENVLVKESSPAGFVTMYGTVAGRTGTFAVNMAQIIYVEAVNAAG